MKKILLNVALFFLISLNISFAGGESTGTTGGGDHKIAVLDLIPNSFKMIQVSPYKEYWGDYIVGYEHCFKFTPWICAVYANRIVATVEFNKEKFLENKKGITETVIAKKGKFEKPYTPNRTRDEFGGVGFEYAYNRIKQDLDGHESAQGKAFYSFKTYWNEKKISLEDFKKHVDTISEAALIQVNFRDMQTLIDFKLVASFLQDAVEGQYDIWDKFRKLLGASVLSESEQLRALISKVVDSSGNCNPNMYLALKTQLKNWNFGSSKWFEKTIVESGIEKEMFGEVIQKAISYRGQVREIIADEVEPYCNTTKAMSLELEEGDEEGPNVKGRTR